MNIKEQAKKIFIQVWEWQNEINLNGILPEKNESKEYLIAKATALDYAFENDNIDVYLYIVNNF